MTSCAYWVSFEYLIGLIAHPQIIVSGCFSSLCPPNHILIPDDPLDDFSQSKFDGEDGTYIAKNIYDFLKWYEYYEIDDENISCVFFLLALKGHINQWCHTLPPTSIYSFDQFLKELHQTFDRYDYQDCFNIINQLRVNRNESIKDFSNWFLHLSN